MNKIFERKIVNIFFSSVLTMFFGALKNRLIETVLFSTKTHTLGTFDGTFECPGYVVLFRNKNNKLPSRLIMHS